MSTNESKLFSSIKYFTTGFRDPSIETKFKENGAIRSFYLTETTTHVISDDFDSNKGELEQAIEIYQTPIVNSNWIIQSLKCNSLLPIEPFLNGNIQNTKHIFRSCIFANANLSNDDHNKIYALVTYYGGQWTKVIDETCCTHIICSSSLSINHSDERLQIAYDIQSDKIHLITPDWIIDCLNSNRLLDEIDYHPDLLRDPMDIDDDDIDDEMNIETNNLNQSNDEQTPTKVTTITHRSQLISKNFFNQSDQTTPPPSVEPATIHTDSSEIAQTKACPQKRARTRVTTTTPRQRQTKLNSTANNNLHSNQNGHTITNKDTNLSTMPIEEKLIRPSVLFTNKNLQIPRHQSLETLSYELNYCLQDKHELVPSSQCLLGCVVYIDEQEYRTIVSKDDLLTWSKVIVDHGGFVTDDMNHPNLTHFICAYRSSDSYRQICKRTNIRMVTAHWLNDVVQRKKLFVPNLAIHYPSVFEPNQSDQLPLSKYFLTMTGFEGIERARLRYMIRSLGGKYSGHLTKWHTHLIAREPAKTEKYKKALEWSIPIVNGLWLSELFLGNTCALKQPLDERYKRLNGTPMIDHFSFDQIFVHDFLIPWSQPIRINDELLNTGIRRHNDQQTNSSLINSKESEKINNSHCFYTQPLNSSMIVSNDSSYSIMLSGFNRKTCEHYEMIIKTLGGQISTIPHRTTHLIMNRFLRTEKFYECMSSVKFVLNQTWLDKSYEENRFVPIDQTDWIIDQQSIDKRIRRQNRPLFIGYKFFLTPSVQPSIKILQSIIYSSGGVLRRNFPTLKQLTTSNEQTKIPNCLILSCENDKVLLKDLHKYNNSDVEIKILSIDFLLQSILHQEILNIDSFVLKIG